MLNKYESVISSEEAEAARELIIELLGKFPKGLNARELGLQLDMSGYTISHIIRPLTKSGKIVRDSVGKNKSLYILNKMNKPVIKPVVASSIRDTSRYIVVFKNGDSWTAEVLATDEAAMRRAKTIADENMGTTVFYGKATRRVCTPKPKTNIEEI